jgi:cellulose biosynthesis protein BcsQ
MTTTFDLSITTFADILFRILPKTWTTRDVMLRNADGNLCLVHFGELSSKHIEEIESAAKELLSNYVDPSLGAVIAASELGEPDLREKARPFLVERDEKTIPILVVDRRIVGQDWSRLPAPGWRSPSAARIVFWSLKGGVGRSTALTVASVDLARRGNRVLVIDLDLEAPGLGSILLTDDLLQEFGVLDWYIEHARSADPEYLVSHMVSASPLSNLAGILHVAPAIGSLSKRHPENVIPKLGRAYLESSFDQSTTTFSDHTANLIKKLEEREQYDVILVDARAGLNETTAASFLGLGADVLIFAENTVQSFDGLRFLLAHLRVLPVTTNDDWRLRLKMVHAKAQPGSGKLFNDRSFELFSDFLYEEETDDIGFNFDIDDPDAPHVPWLVADDSRFRVFDPMSSRDQLSQDLYESTFGSFLKNLSGRLDGAAEPQVE